MTTVNKEQYRDGVSLATLIGAMYTELCKSMSREEAFVMTKEWLKQAQYNNVDLEKYKLLMQYQSMLVTHQDKVH